ncbi:MAG TPA: T9SS type A sorting domain-containing protein, partial [Cyclobacteriaceae bacterium]
GSATFNGTTVSVNISGTAGTLTFSGGSTFNGTVNMTASTLLLNGTSSSLNTFNGTTTLTKTGTTTDNGLGGNVFNGVTTLVNSGSGWLETATATADTFNGNVTLTNTGSSLISLASSTSGNAFNGNIIVNCTAGSGIKFANNTSSGAATLASGKTITVGSTGFTTGTLTLQKFTQSGSTSQALTLTGTATLTLGISSVFNGNVTFISPRLLLNGATYNGTAYLEQNGNTGINGDGGNTFNGTTTIVNSGSSYLTSANTSPDTFNGVLTLTNSGSNGLYIADKAAGTVFNNNVIVNSTAGNGVIFGNNSGATASLASGKTITVGTSFTAGTLGLFRFTQLGSTAQTLTLTGTATLTIGSSSTFNGSVTFKAPLVHLQGCTYNGTAYFEKTGGVQDQLNDGGNTFNATTTLVNSGSGYFAVGYKSADIFNADLTATNTGSGWVALSDGATGTQFNGNIILNSTSTTSAYSNTGGAGITFGNNPGTTTTGTLAAGKTISIGSTGFTGGRLLFRRFTQSGSTAQSFTLTGTSRLDIGNSSTFNGAVTFKAPQLMLNGCTYNGTTYLEKTGATDNAGNGSNIFNGTTTLANSGSGYLASANSTLDTFNGQLTITNTGTNAIYMAHNIAGTVFNDNVIVNCTAGTGIYFCNNSTSATATLATGKTITVGSSGFTTGTLSFKRFTQSGSTAQSLTLTGAAVLSILSSTTFNGNAAFTSPTFILTGTFNGTSSFTKTGSTADSNVGGNVFTGASTITNSGSGTFRFGSIASDNFMADVTVTNSGSGIVDMAYNSTGNTFGGNLTLINTASGSANEISVLRSNSTSASVTGNLTVTNTGSGVTNTIYLGQGTSSSLTIGGALNITHASTGTSNNYCHVANNGTVSVTGNTTISNTSSGTNSAVYVGHNVAGAAFTCGGNLSITHAGSASTLNDFYLANLGSVNISGTTTIVNNCTNLSSYVRICEGSSTASATFGGTFTTTTTSSATGSFVRVLKGIAAFNGDVIINNTATSSAFNGFYIGASGNTGNATLASGKTISIGATGFSTGVLQLYNFTQSGSTAQNITLTGSANLIIGLASLPTTFNGDLTFSTSTGTATLTNSAFKSNLTGTAPSIIITGNTFSGTTSLTKNGTSNDDTNGGNTFSGAATFTTTNTGRWRLGSSSADDYNGDVTFLQNGSGLLQPSYTNSSTYAGNISTVGSGSAVIFGSNSGKVIIDGSSAQVWNGDATNKPSVTKLSMQTGGSALTLGVPVNVTTDLTLTTGIINTTSTNYLNFADNATVTGASNSSYVSGPVRKTGNDAFVFPVGKSNLYRAITMSAPSLTTDQFTAEYFYSAQSYGGPSTWDPSLYNISKCDYWILDRTTGTSSVTVKLSWDDSSCPGGTGYINNLADLRVARFNSATSTWMNEGNGGTTGTTSIGTVISGAAVTSFSPFAVATVSSSNPLPIELSFFKASSDKNNKVILNWETVTEKNNDFFTIERSGDGETFEPIKKISGAGNSTLPINYTSVDDSPLRGLSYYRLKQTDFDGHFAYSRIVAVQINAPSTLYLYPNPSIGGEFFVQLSEQNNGLSKITISDAKGVIVYVESIEVSNGLIHVEKIESLAAGFYKVSVESSEGMHTYKLIVN